MRHTIFSWTEAPTPKHGYPAYISINRDDDGVHSISVRRSGQVIGATIDLPVQTLEAMGVELLADLYRDETPIEHKGRVEAHIKGATE